MNIDNVKKIPSNHIFIFENSELINDHLFQELIDYINNASEYIVEEWGNRCNVQSKCMLINTIEDYEVKQKFDNYIFKIINYIVNKLYTEYGITCSGDSGYCLRKIHGETRLHKDGINVDTINDTYISRKKIRNMAIIMALNDDYDEGEFYFPVQDVRIKLKKGQIIAFPPYWTHPHMVNAPTNGTYRYTINTWLFE